MRATGWYAGSSTGSRWRHERKLDGLVAQLAEAGSQGDQSRIRALLQDIVSTYAPAPGGEGDEMLVELLDAAPEEH